MHRPLIRREVPLTDRNTLRLRSVAELFAEPATDDELLEALAYGRRHHLPVTVLGEGSNVVLSPYLPGLTICVRLEGIGIEGPEVSARAGVNWDRLVHETISRGAFGLENLALIPGMVGAAPIQNIGAYGVELSAFVREVRAVHRKTLQSRAFSAAECGFAYRDSVFKARESEQWVITDVRLRLRADDRPELAYKGVREAVDAAGLEVSARSVARVVSEIRRRKLPDPSSTPNAGSFFKNPIVDSGQAGRLRSQFPDMPMFEIENGFRIPAAWLIEKANLKGRSQDAVMMSRQHALVLTNTGGADAVAVNRMAETVRREVAARFSVTLEQEPRGY